MKNIIYKFLFESLKYKEFELVDITFAKLFEFNNDNYSCIYMLFASIVSLSTRKGNVCLFLNQILNNNFFTNYIKNFLFYFFNNYISLKKCIELMFINDIISSWYQNRYTPLILFNDCIYLYKYWFYENYIINYLNKNLLVKKVSSFLDKKIYFYMEHLNIKKYFYKLIFSILNNKITIISGGPGTGKSMLIIKLVFFLYKICKFNINNSIILLSLTGKSSSLLNNSLFNKINKFNINLRNKFNFNIKCYTLHKYLGYNFNYNYIKYNINNKIKANYIIIDECSMLDLVTFYNFISSLDINTKIILVGDKDQISSIECGSVFNEICNLIKNKLIIKKYNNYILNYKNFFFLNKNYRYKNNKYLYKFLNLIKVNYKSKLYKFIYNKNINFKYNINFYDSNKFDYNFLLKLCISHYSNYINLIKLNFFDININLLFKYFNKNKIICILKDSKYGINILNKYINNYLITNNLTNINYKNILSLKNNYNGEPILIIRNNNYIKLFNGDIGFFYINKFNKLRLIFKNLKEDIHPFILENYWINSWAITVHKSQGLEYDNILLILPNRIISLLNNNIIYTALSRAKKNIIIYGDINIFWKSIKNYDIKYNNIINRINVF